MPTLAALGPFASFSPGSAGSLYFFRILVVLTLPFAVLQLWRRRHTLGLVPTAYAMLVLAIITWGPVTLLWTPNRPAGVRELTGIALAALGGLAIVGLVTNSSAELQRLRRGFILSFVIVAIIGTQEAVFRTHLYSLRGTRWPFAPSVIAASFNNSNDYAMYIVLCMGPISFGLARASSRTKRALYGVFYLWALALLLRTDSRSGLLAAGLVTLALVYWLLRIASAPTRKRLVVPTAAVSVLFIALLASPLGSAILRGFARPFQKHSDYSDAERVRLSRAAWDYLTRAPLTGTGAGSFRTLLAADRTRPTGGVVIDPHDTLLQLAMQYGILVTISLLILLLGMCATLLLPRAANRRAECLALRVQLTMTLIALGIASFAQSTALTQPAWWLALAYAVSTTWVLRRKLRSRVPDLGDAISSEPGSDVPRTNASSAYQAAEKAPHCGSPAQPGQPRRIGIITALYPPAHLGGGPIRTVSAMVKSAKAPESTFILTSDRDLGQSARLPVASNEWTDTQSARVYYMSDDSLIGYVRGLLALRSTAPELVYLNSLFSWKYSLLPQMLGRFGFWRQVPILIAPRGELDGGALALKAFKKRLFLNLYSLMRFPGQTVWHASTPLETRNIKNVFHDARVIVRENETLLPERADPPRFTTTEPLRLIYLGRISPKKGLTLLLQGVSLVQHPVVIDVFGNLAEDPAYAARCRRQAGELPGHITVHFHGALRPQEVRDAFRTHEAFYFPTRGENFGHVVAEALSVSCPVYACDVTPWTPILMSGGGGLIEDFTPESWALSIDNLASLSSDERYQRRKSAGAAYESWRARDRGPNVFERFFNEAELHRSR